MSSVVARGGAQILDEKWMKGSRLTRRSLKRVRFVVYRWSCWTPEPRILRAP